MIAPMRTSEGAVLRAATETDFPGVLALLREAGLPLDGVQPGLVGVAVAELDGEVVGVAGLERYGTSALLRSVAVAPGHRGHRVAGRLVERLLEEARCECIHDVYLRTTTASDYFPRFGFTPVPLDAVPEAVRGSVEFQGACPESAQTMVCCLDEAAGR